MAGQRSRKSNAVPTIEPLETPSPGFTPSALDHFDPILATNNGTASGNVNPIITSPDEIRTGGTNGGVEPLEPDADLVSLGYTLSNYHPGNRNNSANVNNEQSDLQANMDVLQNDYPATSRKPKTTLNAGTNSGVPGKKSPFVVKLWRMINDPLNASYIHWIDNGTSFQVADREAFMKYVLPQYFKHNNFSSFVRQLNMYGFHKIQDLTQGTLTTQESGEIYQFHHDKFRRGREDLLDQIVRNKPKEDAQQQQNAQNGPSSDIKQLVSQLEILKNNQKLMADDLMRVRRDNELLWKENFIAREKHKIQSETLDKILRFLASVYGNNTSKLLDQVSANNGVGANLDLQPFVQQPQPQRTNKNDLNQWWQNGLNNNTSNGANFGGDNFSDMFQSQSPLPSGALIGGNDHLEQLEHLGDVETVDTGDNNGDLLLAQNTGNRQPLMITQRPHGSFSSTASSRPQMGRSNGGNNSYLPTIEQLPDDSPGSITGNNTSGFQLPVKEYTPQPNTPEGIIGNINQQLAENDQAINQVNDWISKYSKPMAVLPEDDGSNNSSMGDFLQSPIDSKILNLSEDNVAPEEVPVPVDVPVDVPVEIPDEGLGHVAKRARRR